MSKKKQTDVQPEAKADSQQEPQIPTLSPEDAAAVETAPETSDSRPQTDDDVIEGFGMTIGEDTEDQAAEGDEPLAPEAGEGDSSSMSPEPKAPSPAKADSEGKRVYKVGKREFDSPEALAAYVDGLEQSQLDILDKIKDPGKTQAAEPEVDLAELIFENPKKALEIMEARAEARVKKEFDERDARKAAEVSTKRTWEAFYKSNPDLAGFEDIVNIQFDKIAQDPATTNLPTSKGLELIAKQARERVNALRLKFKPSEELPSDPAITSGSGGAEVPTRKQQPRVSSFIDDVKGLRRGAAR